MKTDLSHESYINLETFRRSGVGVLTPVWFASIGDKLYVFTDGTSAKVKRIRANPKSRIAACNVWGKITGEWHDAHARLVENPKEIEAAYEALRAKYGWQMWLIDTTSRLAGRFDRRVILEIH